MLIRIFDNQNSQICRPADPSKGSATGLILALLVLIPIMPASGQTEAKMTAPGESRIDHLGSVPRLYDQEYSTKTGASQSELVIPRGATGLGWDIAADWSDLSNPNGVWSYNEDSAPITSHVDAWVPLFWLDPQPAWAGVPDGFGHIPSWLKCVTTNTVSVHDLPIGAVGVHSSDPTNSNDLPANVTWTSPINGTIEIQGGVWQASPHVDRGNDWTLYLNGAALTGGQVFGSDAFTSATPFDFANGSGGQTALNQTVSVGSIIKLEVVRATPIGAHVGVNLSIVPLLGDLNCDGQVDTLDVNPFVLALIDPAAFAIAFPSCDIIHGDMNADATADGHDIQDFITKLVGA